MAKGTITAPRARFDPAALSRTIEIQRLRLFPLGTMLACLETVLHDQYVPGHRGARPPSPNGVQPTAGASAAPAQAEGNDQRPWVSTTTRLRCDVGCGTWKSRQARCVYLAGEMGAAGESPSSGWALSRPEHDGTRGRRHPGYVVPAIGLNKSKGSGRTSPASAGLSFAVLSIRYRLAATCSGNMRKNTSTISIFVGLDELVAQAQ